MNEKLIKALAHIAAFFFLPYMLSPFSPFGYWKTVLALLCFNSLAYHAGRSFTYGSKADE